MVTGGFRDLFVTIATAAATLIGLLFVALSVAESRANNRPRVVRQFRAAASFIAFINTLTVTLFGLVPGTNVGYPALVLGITGLLFTAAGVRRTLELSVRRLVLKHLPFLVVALLAVFGFEFAFGVILLNNPHDSSALSSIGDILIASMLIGIARSWELVSEWNTGAWASLGVLLGPHPVTEEEGENVTGEQSAPGTQDKAPGDQQ
jgi:hypothetical protein